MTRPNNSTQQYLVSTVTTEEETLLNILHTSDRLMGLNAKMLREFGLTPSQYNLLRILHEEGEPLPSLEIANRMIFAVPAITGLIDRVEKAGYVKRERCDQDRRVVYVQLTKLGHKKLDETIEPIEDLNRELMGHLTQKDHQQLAKLLAKAREKVIT